MLRILHFVVALLSFGALHAAEGYPPDIQRIMDRGELLVAMYRVDTPPFYFRDSQGRMDGIDVRIIDGFARRMGVKIRYDRSATTFDQVIDLVAERKADVAISKLSMTFLRATRVRFSNPYLHLRQALLVNRLQLARMSRGRSRQEVLRDFSGKIGVIGRSAYVDAGRRRFPRAEIVEFDAWDAVVDATARGTVMAAYRDEVEVQRIVRQRPETALKFLPVILPDTKDTKAIVVHWENPNLLSLMNFYLDSLDLRLDADRVLNHYDQVISEIEEKVGGR